MGGQAGAELTIITLRMPIELVKQIDYLVALGLFPSRSEVIRHAVVRFLTEEYNKLRNLGGGHGGGAGN